MSDSKIVWDADTGRVDSKLDRTKERAVAVGKAIGRWGNEVSSAALRIGSLVKIIDSVGSELERSQNKLISGNKSAGSGIIERGRSIRALGLDNRPGGAAAADEMIRNLTGGTSLEDRQSFLAQLAGASRSSKIPFKQEDIARAISLHAEGVTGGDEIIKSISSGRLRDLEMENGARRGRLSAEEKAELSDRDFERQKQVVTEDASRNGRARRLRLGQAAIEARDAENPGIASFKNLVGSATAIVGGDNFIRSGELALFVDMNKNLSAIAATNKKMANGQPTLTTSPDGVP